MNKHSLVLLIVLVLIGIGMFSLMGYQRNHAYAPEVKKEGSGLIFAGGAPAQPSQLDSVIIELPTATDAGAASCP